MKLTYAFVPGFECVMMLNGAFKEKPAPLSYPAASPLYVTLFPLHAIYLPYTVRLLGGKVMSNPELASVHEIGSDRYIVTFAERHNYVYSPQHTVTPPARDMPEKLFRFVKAGDISSARTLMTAELSESVDDDAIIEFFQPFSTITLNPYTDLQATHFLSPAAGGRATGFVIRQTAGKISDMEEV